MKHKLSELTGENLCAAVLMATPNHKWETDVPMPDQDPADCMALIIKHRINVRPGLEGIDPPGMWVAYFLNNSDARRCRNEYEDHHGKPHTIGIWARNTVQEGSDIYEAVCRTIVFAVFGAEVEL